MNTDSKLGAKIRNLVDNWRQSGLPGQFTLHEIADELMAWRQNEKIPGLWTEPPVIFGVTMDDGWGHGIQIILKYAALIGCQTEFLGLLMTWEEIAAICQDRRPDILGLTVLQLDTEEDIGALREHIPAQTRIVAGGPVFKIDDELASRVGIDYVADDVGCFLNYMLNW